ncbi:MAG: hypothetical protein M5R36_22855 [Deltaproteobacteria bacterium]|nr:hypothetical protein [Deltaproteobacteria bacterium]
MAEARAVGVRASRFSRLCAIEPVFCTGLDNSDTMILDALKERPPWIMVLDFYLGTWLASTDLTLSWVVEHYTLRYDDPSKAWLAYWIEGSPDEEGAARSGIGSRRDAKADKPLERRLEVVTNSEDAESPTIGADLGERVDVHVLKSEFRIERKIR